MKAATTGSCLAALLVLVLATTRGSAARSLSSKQSSPQPLHTNPGGPVNLVPSPPVPSTDYPQCSDSSVYQAGDLLVRSLDNGKGKEACTEISVRPPPLHTVSTIPASVLPNITYLEFLFVGTPDGITVTFRGQQLQSEVDLYGTGIGNISSFSLKVAVHATAPELIMQPGQICFRAAVDKADTIIFPAIELGMASNLQDGLRTCADIFMHVPGNLWDPVSSHPSPSLHPVYSITTYTSPTLAHPPTLPCPSPTLPPQCMPTTPAPQVIPPCDATNALKCGTDKPYCDLHLYQAPDSTFPSDPTRTDMVHSGFTVSDCLKQCQKTPLCQSFVIRQGVCFLKPYRFGDYPEVATDFVLSCPSEYSYQTTVESIGEFETIIGDAVCHHQTAVAYKSESRITTG